MLEQEKPLLAGCGLLSGFAQIPLSAFFLVFIDVCEP